MDNSSSVIGYGITLILFAAILATVILLSMDTIKERDEIRKAENAALSGIIVKKDVVIIDKLFKPRIIEHRIYIEYDYTESKREKYFVVSEETYMFYKKGDFFDVQDYSTTIKQTENPT